MDKILDNIDLNSKAPFDEPDRQYYFMAKCREYVAAKKKELNRPLFFNIKTFGCQMNAKDSEKLTGILEAIGYEQAENEIPDFVLYNTCTVRENANLKVYGNLGNIKKLKKKNPEMIIALCGCMMQEKEVVDKIKKSYSFVDLIFGTHNIFKLAELMYEILTNKKKVYEIFDKNDLVVENLPSVRKYSFKCGVNIMYGCDNFCTYCIVPYVRGREKSRKKEHIIAEIENLVKNGVVEVMLLGQNVNSYGKGLDEKIDFATLLTEIEKIEGLERIRFMTPHPKDFSDDLIRVMKNSKKICKHVHLPLQSGSSRILTAMNRHYSKEDYLNLVDKIRNEIPDVGLTTDIIVGFPGETDEDFLDTLDVVSKVKFDSAYTFIYSKRTGTPAAKMENQVSEDVIKERFDRLLKEVQSGSAYRNKLKEGTTERVLIEEVNSQDKSLCSGRLSNNSIVHFKCNKDMIGKFVDVRLDEAKGFYYYGTIISNDEAVR